VIAESSHVRMTPELALEVAVWVIAEGDGVVVLQTTVD